MSWFTPNIVLKDITRIDLGLLKANGLKGLVLDVDNTLTTHGSQHLRPDISMWIHKMKENGIKLVVVSNNTKERVEPFAKAIGLNFVPMALKPLPRGFKRAAQEMGLSIDEIGVVGDQIYTDIVGGNMVGMYTVLVNPMMSEDNTFFKIKRTLESIHIKEYYRRNEAIEHDRKG